MNVKIPDINDGNIDIFINMNENAIIFFLNKSSQVKQYSKSIELHDDEIKFAVAPPGNYSKDICFSYPCIAAYKDHRYIRSTLVETRPLSFEFWLKATLGKNDMEITHQEQLRRILSFSGSTVFVVDMNLRPYYIPKDVRVLFTYSYLFNAIGLNVKKGVYIYRHGDRELIKINDWSYSSYESTLLDPGSSNITSHPFLVGLFLDKSSANYGNEMFKTAIDLSQHYSNSGFRFTVFDDELANEMSFLTGLPQTCVPRFVVLNTSNITGIKWRFIGKDIISKEKIINKLTKIASGLKEPNILSLPSRTNSPKLGVTNALSLLDFEKDVLNSNKVSIVFLISSCDAIQKEFSALMISAASIYKDYGVQIFEYDQSMQDPLPNVPLFKEYPQIIGYSGNGNEKPYLYKDKLSLVNFIDFMDLVSNNKTHLSDIEIKAFRRQLMQDANSYGSARQQSRKYYKYDL